MENELESNDSVGASSIGARPLDADVSSPPDSAEATIEPFDLPADVLRLSPRQVTLERISSVGVTGVLSLIALLGLVNGLLGTGLLASLRLAWLVSAALGAMGLLALAWWLPAAAYRRCGYRITADGLEIRRGVWWRSIHLIPHARLQHVDVEQGPIQRRFDLATVTIYTAGTSHASIVMQGLSLADAVRLRDRLIEKP